MSGPSSPPPPDWEVTSGSAAQFAAAQGLAANGYDSTNQSFKDSSGNPHYLYAGTTNTAGQVAWWCKKPADSNDMPQGKIPQATFTVVKDGALNTQTGVITANGTSYRLVLKRDANGVQVAHAEQV